MPKQFPRTDAVPAQSPLYWVEQKDRYLRQLLIEDIEQETGRRLLVYFGNRIESPSIDNRDVSYIAELWDDVPADAQVDLLLETVGGDTDATEAIISFIASRCTDLRVIVANAAKSNGTLIALMAKAIVMGAPSELGPIDPSANGIPCTILADPGFPIVDRNAFVLHQFGKHGLAKTRALAEKLLAAGMMNGADPATVNSTVTDLASKDRYFSHGSVIDHREAVRLGLKVEYLAPDAPLWRRLWLLYCMYDFDSRQRRYKKIFESKTRSAAIAAPPPPPVFVPPKP